jgi:hypothetical protein
VKTGCNLAESSKEGYGWKRSVLPMMMMMAAIMQSRAAYCWHMWLIWYLLSSTLKNELETRSLSRMKLSFSWHNVIRFHQFCHPVQRLPSLSDLTYFISIVCCQLMLHLQVEWLMQNRTDSELVLLKLIYRSFLSKVKVKISLLQAMEAHRVARD